jgi:hypothetical protein
MFFNKTGQAVKPALLWVLCDLFCLARLRAIDQVIEMRAFLEQMGASLAPDQINH